MRTEDTTAKKAENPRVFRPFALQPTTQRPGKILGRRTRNVVRALQSDVRYKRIHDRIAEHTYTKR